MIWIELAACAALIIWAGTLLSKYGDVIAEKTGLGRVWGLSCRMVECPESCGWRRPGKLPFQPGPHRVHEVLEKEASENSYAAMPAPTAYSVFVISAISVIALGIWLSFIGDRLASTTGLSRSFVGNLFLAISTSLPEMAARLAAIRLGAIDLAIGNVPGSNLFNITLFFVYDLADGRNNFWASLTNADAFAAVMTLMMTTPVIISLIYRASPRTPYRFSWDGFALVVIYVGSIVVLYWPG